MDTVSSITCFFVLIYIVYLIIDYLIRIPRVGGYSGRYILITGCDTGFGNAAAKRLDKLGCNVFAGCFTETGETELRKVCSERLHTISLDVTKRDSVRKAFEYVNSKLPQGTGLWGVLNNAGVVTGFGPVDWFAVDDYRKACEVNLWGLIDVTMTFLPLVKMAKGRIVNTSSAAGRLAFDYCVPYCASKFGVEGFTDGLRRCIFHFGCKASLIEPGGHNTPITNANIVTNAIQKSWENAPLKVQEEYGKDFVDKEAAYINQLFLQFPDDVSPVVDAYEQALLSCFPRERYAAGWDAKLSVIVIAALPEWLADWIVRKQLSGQPRSLLARN